MDTNRSRSSCLLLCVPNHSHMCTMMDTIYISLNITLPFSPAVATNVLLSFAAIPRLALFGISTKASIDYKHIIIQTTYLEIILRISKTGIVFLLFPSLMSHTLMILSLPTLHTYTHYNTIVLDWCVISLKTLGP